MKTLSVMAMAAFVVAGTAQAQVSTTVPQETAFDPEICVESSAANATVLAAWAEAETDEAKLTALRAAVAGDDNWNAVCLANAVGKGAKQSLLSDLIAVLNEHPDDNAEVIAALLVMVESEGGPDENQGTDVNFGTTTNTPGENQSQLNSPQDDGSESSPEILLF